MRIGKNFFSTIAIVSSFVVSHGANAGSRDPLATGMGFLDVLSNIVAQEKTGKNYLDYQYERYGLQPSQRFPSAAHATVYARPLCGDDQGIREFLNQECRIHQVVESKIGCAGRGKHCIAFKLADAVTRDDHLMMKISAAIGNPRSVVIEPGLVDQQYGARDLQTPGLILSPHAQWFVLGLDKKSTYKAVMRQHDREIYSISFRR